MPKIMANDMVPTPDTTACIDQCLLCYRTCLGMVYQICIPAGGRHIEAQHLSLMNGCAQICKTAADFMLMDNPLHHKVCGVCAEICEACGHSCAQVGDMDECVEVCRACADLCRRMALNMPKPQPESI